MGERGCHGPRYNSPVNVFHAPPRVIVVELILREIIHFHLYSSTSWGAIFNKFAAPMKIICRQSHCPLEIVFWVISTAITVAFQISVHIRVFILRKNTGPYGRIWAYTLMKYMAVSPYTLHFEVYTLFLESINTQKPVFPGKINATVTSYRCPIAGSRSSPIS